MKAPDIITAKDGRLVLALDKGIYPLDVIYGAAYSLIDRAYILLDKTKERVLVDLAAKDPDGGEAALRSLAGDFGNELLNQVLRKRITRDNRTILETIVSQALAGATGMAAPSGAAPTETDILDEFEEDDLSFLDDPLGIAVPWEERFEAKDGEPAKGAEQADAPGTPDAEADQAGGE